MTEQIREQLPSPDLYRDAAASPNLDPAYVGGRIAAELESSEAAGPNVITRSSVDTAREVANAIKPDVDEYTSLQERIDAPMAGAFAMDRGDGTLVVKGGVENVGQLRRRREGVKADLERNARNATDLAVQERMGGVIVRSQLEK